MMDQDEFNVYQFFADESYECVCQGVGPAEAVRKAHACCSSVGARIGTTRRVIITDREDCTNFEWCYGKGITFGLSDVSLN
jgi:hypothetical protein